MCHTQLRSYASLYMGKSNFSPFDLSIFVTWPLGGRLSTFFVLESWPGIYMNLSVLGVVGRGPAGMNAHRSRRFRIFFHSSEH